jgi:hypothetical protein
MQTETQLAGINAGLPETQKQQGAASQRGVVVSPVKPCWHREIWIESVSSWVDGRSN